MLPTVGADSLKVARYAAEVGGRTLGVAAMQNLVPDATRRASLEKSGNAIISVAQQLNAAYVARINAEHLDQRIAFGKGRAIDRGFEAIVSIVSETIRTSLPDRNTANPDYRAIFPHGTEEFITPTIKEDAQIASDLRDALSKSNLAVKNETLALLDSAIPVVGSAATALKTSEQQVNSLFVAEQSARKLVVDTLWEERKSIETALGRAGKGLARFIYFDFRRPGETPSSDDVAAPETGNGT
jgi:hypothetical protein